MIKFTGTSLVLLIALAGQAWAQNQQSPSEGGQAQGQQRPAYQGKSMPPNMPGTYTVIHNADMQALINGKNPHADTPLRVIDTRDGHYGAFILTYQPESPKPGAVAHGTYHTSVTEMYYVLDGTGSMILGGELVDAKENDPEGYPVKSVAGPTAGGVIKDYTVVAFTPGTLVIVPAGVPHSANYDITSRTDFLVIRIDPKKTVDLK